MMHNTDLFNKNRDLKENQAYTVRTEDSQIRLSLFKTRSFFCHLIIVNSDVIASNTVYRTINRHYIDKTSNAKMCY